MKANTDTFRFWKGSQYGPEYAKRNYSFGFMSVGKIMLLRKLQHPELKKQERYIVAVIVRLNYTFAYFIGFALPFLSDLPKHI